MTDLPVDFLESYDNESVLAELCRLSKLTSDGAVSKRAIESAGRVSYSTIVKRFGSLRKALELAGLSTSRFTKATDTELLASLVELWQRVLETEGRTPQRKDLSAFGYLFSGDTVLRRFGSWRAALLRARDSVTIESAEQTEQVSNSAKPVRTRQTFSLRKRFFVMKRDGFCCVRCGACGHGVRLEVNHHVPFAKGGTDALDNLETLCFDCNRGQRDDLV
ncbi:MAG: HNH endonuclease [Gammaproteobacteria bacterium]